MNIQRPAEEIEVARAAIERFCSNGRVKLGLAQRLIKESAYWYGHPQGPVAAPRHYERVHMGPHGLQLEFGANKFLVGTAIVRCRDGLLVMLDAIEAGKPPEWASASFRLQRTVCGAVANHFDEEYPQFWETHDGHMLFGTQSIHVPSFVRELLVLAEFGPIQAFLDLRKQMVN